MRIDQKQSFVVVANVFIGLQIKFTGFGIMEEAQMYSH
jgi:hypothetical protein